VWIFTWLFSPERDDPANQQSKVKLIPKVVGGYTHSSVRYHELAEWAHCIVDTRNAMAGVSVAPGKVWKA